MREQLCRLVEEVVGLAPGRLGQLADPEPDAHERDRRQRQPEQPPAPPRRAEIDDGTGEITTPVLQIGIELCKRPPKWNRRWQKGMA